MTTSLAALDEIVVSASKNSRIARLSRGKGVRASEEFRRIDALPRRIWDPGIAEELAAEMTAVLRQPTGTFALKPTQAIALLELGLYAGLLGPMRAGAGKSLVTYLAPYVMGAERPVLVVPAKLREKTEDEIREWLRHFRVAYWLHVKSYEELGRVGCARFLEDLRADLVILDEAHKVKNPRAAVTKRIRRYVEHSDCRVIALSGTFTKRSVSDFAHTASWTLDSGAPVPRTWGDIEEWSCALDERPRSSFRVPPGALTHWSGGSEDLTAVREGFQRRLTETPGVVATFDTLTDCSLVISRLETPGCPQITEAFRLLREEGTTPDGYPVIDGLDAARHARELALGFFSRWEPRAPEEWSKRRREWGQLVRYVLTHNRSGIDSELQVAQACAARTIPVTDIAKKIEATSDDPHAAWAAIRDSFTPNPTPVWISGVALEAAASWVRDGGIVWCEHVPFAEALAELTGIPYAGAGGTTADGVAIEALKTHAVIASRQSSGEGRNLQHQWARNLVTSSVSQGAIWEQLLARTHRDGQPEDEVTFAVLSGSLENETAWEQARKDAAYIAAVTGQEQRLGYATILWDPPKNAAYPVWKKETSL